MKRSDRLAVWLHGRHIAWLTGTSLRPRLEYLPDVVAEYGAGAVLLSLSLPLQSKPITGPAVLNFFDGLLPEGQVRAHLSELYKVPSTDIRGLLAAVGGDCAGAVQVLPEGRDPAGGGSLQPMSRKELVAAVESLPTWDLPPDFAIATSLGGVQSKILLSRDGGRWYWPSGGAASTHIIKPDPFDSPIQDLLAAEHWALNLAGALNLPAARSNLERFGSREALIVERYDRTKDHHRIHQEDFTQVLGISSAAKYDQSTAGPSRLAQVAAVAAPHTRSPTIFKMDLLKLVSYNLLIGNGDAHSKNYSVLIRETGEVTLAPLYDAAPTLLLYARSSNAGHSVAGQARLNYITLDHLVREAAGWGLDSDAARTTVSELFSAAAEAPEAAPDRLAGLPSLVASRAVDLLQGRTARRQP
ncbi:type II toxin-antitoxin system HipA family toxin [Pseudarthrobacter sp. BIM B-2242]|uniref:type II toxin-antitoxin system HipA family toxin n=1 Tax=Pseudarthrobacter sp. BIM B-2242 TaxID=2772401 RepID=UPI00168AFD5B|nr:HipA domain-containing protein [Pseudarthrobacter sp. BIM B-2242]QOD04346.1 HipA domain-containing protein [Pseudarthrobacter sp. BIM B-2242]